MVNEMNEPNVISAKKEEQQRIKKERSIDLNNDDPILGLFVSNKKVNEQPVHGPMAFVNEQMKIIGNEFLTIRKKLEDINPHNTSTYIEEFDAFKAKQKKIFRYLFLLAFILLILVVINILLLVKLYL